MKSSNKNISKIRNVILTLENFQKNFQNAKKIEKIHMDSEKLINSLEKKKVRSPDCLWDNNFCLHFKNNFSPLLLWKIYVFDIFNMIDFFRFLLYREVMTF